MYTTITYYPVGNGDCDLIKFANGAKMMIDCNFRTKSEDENNDQYDVISDLLDNKLTSKNHGLPFLSTFVLTHPDEDHCRGFKEKFFRDKNPEENEPSQEDKDAKKILIGELWYSPRVFTEHQKDLSEDAKAFKKEADRRMELYKNSSVDANKDGNRIRIIGYAETDKLEGIPDDRISAAGSTITEINGKTYSDLRIFVHAPFKDSIENDDRNETSIVLQIRVDTSKKTDAGKFIFGGDAAWRVWQKIQEKTKDEENMKWNLMEAPHHCSWHFFADKKEDEPQQSAIDFLGRKDGNGYIVSSSNEINAQTADPPSQKAKNRYVKELDSEDYFRCTSEKVDGNVVEKPVVFEVQDDGIHLVAEKKGDNEKATESRTSRPHLYG